MAESGASASEMCALFGWSKLETAEIYIRDANKRIMVDSAFARLDEQRKLQSVSLQGRELGSETNRRKSPEKPTRK
jgi:hypothetical protein